MAQYIDKSALVAEIEEIIADETESIKSFEHGKNVSEVQRSNARMGILIHIRSLLDTLEVKEVDLEKEINKYISDNFFGSETMGFFAVRTKEEPDDQDIALCAKHFFELGLSVNNPVTAADRGTAEEIIINLKRVEQDYRIDLTKEMEWVRNQAKKGE